MPVVMKSTNARASMKLLGVPAPHLELLDQPGWQAKLTAKGFELWYEEAFDAFKTDKKHVPFGLDMQQQLKAGTLDPTKKLILKGHLVNTIQNLKDVVDAAKKATPVYTGDPDMGYVAPSGGGDTAFETMKKLVEDAQTEPKVWSDKFAMTAVDTGGVEDKFREFDGDMLHAELIPLRQATRLYQPVKGTSPGVRYYLIAANEDIRVAARRTGNGLAIRIEGPGLAKHSKAVSAIGFEVKDKATYASLHLGAQDKVLAFKTLGAILGGLGFDFQTKQFNPNRITVA